MNKVIGALALSMVMLAACNENQPDKDSSLGNTIIQNSSDTSAASLPTVATTVDSASAALTPVTLQAPPTVVPGTNTSAPGNVVQAASPAAKPALAGMNPAHGQPNHRCDIAVGAPLNSPVTKPAVQTATSAATPAAAAATPSVTQTQTVTPSKPKLLNDPAMKGKPNPAHGQPGHDCAVPVGQTL